MFINKDTETVEVVDLHDNSRQTYIVREAIEVVIHSDGWKEILWRTLSK